MASGAPLRFSKEVEDTLTEVLPSDDPLDRPDFDPTEYINERFPTARSLDGLDAFIVEIREKLRASEMRLMDAVKVQATTATKAASDLRSAKDAVIELHQRVSDIKGKADASEAMVSNICDSIRHLDTAKGNLSKSIKTLSDLQLYIRNVQNLVKFTDVSDWYGVNSALRKAQGYRHKFQPFEDTPKVRELADKLTQHEKQLEFQLCSRVILDLLADTRAEETNNSLRDACLVVDALGSDVVLKFRQKYTQALLEPYAALFRRGSEDAAFERTERRFAFIKKTLDLNANLFTRVFPRNWCVAQELCVEFCLRTNAELSALLRDEIATIEIAALVYILQRTIEFEKDLTNRVRALQAEADEEAAALRDDTDEPLAPLPEYKYYGMIVRCFETHMEQYVHHENTLLEKTVTQSLQNDGVVEDLLVLQSSQDIFLFIQESSSRSARFAGEATMADLARVWLKHLQNYAALLTQKCSTIPNTPEKQEEFCYIINSADYSRSATESIGVDLAKFAESELQGLVPEIEAATDAFVKLSSVANQQLVDRLCLRMQPIVAELQQYLAINFNSGGSSDAAHLDATALDESPASKRLRREYVDIVRLAAKSLHPHCFPFMMNKLAGVFISKYWALALYRPKARHSDLALNQLQIDIRSLENMFLTTPNEVINSAAQRNATSAGPVSYSRASVLGSRSSADGPRISLTTYQKTVKREAQYLASTLKVMQMPANDSFIHLYYQVTPVEKRSLTDCARLLELKGVRADDTRQLIALLKRFSDVPLTTPRDALYETAQQRSGILPGFFAGRDDGAPPSGSSSAAAQPSPVRGAVAGLFGRATATAEAAPPSTSTSNADDARNVAWRKIKDAFRKASDK